jgi:hypothetical protein
MWGDALDALGTNEQQPATNTLARLIAHMSYRGPLMLDVSHSPDGWAATSEWNPRSDEMLTGVVTGYGDSADAAVAAMLDNLDERIKQSFETFRRIENDDARDRETGRGDQIDDRADAAYNADE